ncbi:2-methylcitrate dehydratase PrpD, partial [Bradyrhizobium sp. Rc2d]|uniref:MmgE/PrpD family protein n=3 Tax=Bradyrhizobium sp. Rc2d TaxID=1855321 RepID=UPI00088EDDED
YFMTKTTERLARWVSSLRYESLPSEVIGKAKLCLADSISCMVGGADLVPSKTLLKVLCRSGQGSVAVPGVSARLGLLDAAYYGAQTANALDFDDDLIGHPGATVVPIALAVGQVAGANGADLVTAIVAGYEVSMRIGESCMPTYERSQNVKGYSTWQTFGSVVSAAKLLSLSDVLIENAMGLAGAQAPVPNVRKFMDRGACGWLKNAYGIAGEIGVLSAHLAAESYAGNRNIFDGPNGFWIMSGSDQFRPQLAVNGLGAIWKIDDVNFKEYACCYYLQSALDAIDLLKNRQGTSDVERIEIRAFLELPLHFCGPLPNSIVEAQFHAPYLVALQWLGRSPAQGLREEDLTDPTVLALARKVALRHDPAMDRSFRECDLYPVRVIATDKFGASSEAFVERPRAAEQSSQTQELVERKFFSIVSPKLGEKATTHAWNMIHEIEKHSVDELVRILVP